MSQASKSFPRFEPSEASPTGQGRIGIAIHHETGRKANATRSSAPAGPVEDQADIFEHHCQDGAEDISASEGVGTFPEGYNDLPIEIQSLLERFLESLSAKANPIPLSIDRLAELYQDFYAVADSHISTHIATLASRMSREKSPAPSVSSVSSKNALRKASKPDGGGDIGPVHQMLTTSEITDKRKARKMLDLKRKALEEAVEKGVCEKVYPRLWRHSSTDDEARDEKVRSRAAALALVGVDLRELLATALSNTDDVGTLDLGDVRAKSDSVRVQLADARRSMQLMNHERYPLGKLQHLTAAHKSIVEVLSQLFPSTSSADEILPTLIYTIIISDPDTTHIVSNFNFIQRFRASSKIDGEAAYCLTNLEAAISFLETVDLSSIRSEEGPEGLAKSTIWPTMPRAEKPDPLYHGLPNEADSGIEKLDPGHLGIPNSPNGRRLSSLLQSQPPGLSNLGIHVVLDGADAAIDTLHSALDGSFRFLFGRLREKQASQTSAGVGEIAVPRTLEDARKLVGTNSDNDDDDISIGGGSGVEPNEDTPETDDHNKMWEAISGRRVPMPRDHSADSTVSGSSAKRVAFSKSRSPTSTINPKKREASPKSSTATITMPTTTPPVSGLTAVESMRNLGNSLNPLRSLSGLSMMRGFGRTTSASSTPTTASTVAHWPLEQAVTEEPAPLSPSLDLSGIAPPIARFVGMKDAREMNFYDIELLLRDYQRLAGALKAVAGLGTT